MALKDDLEKEIKNIFKSTWTSREGKLIPSDTSVTLGNDCVKIEATVLYADLAKSTQTVKNNVPETAAEIYKTFLITALRIIKANGGEITAFDGDRVMSVFMGKTPNTDAAKTALQINYAIQKIVQPAFDLQYPDLKYKFEYGIGIDTSKILVAKTGIRNANDLVWVGNAANIAAKLCSIRNTGKSVWISESCYKMLADTSKYSDTSPKQNMWSSEYNVDLGMTVYNSTWIWPI